MTELSNLSNFDISVVVPAFNADRYLPLLLAKIEAQTLQPKEIVIVDSGTTGLAGDLLENWQGQIPVVYKKVDFSYPGHARNIGVQAASGSWIAFLDCRTRPNPDWLETSALIADKAGVEFVEALCLSDADTEFKKILLAATYGREMMRTLPGSLIRKKAFERSGGFLPLIRAGEDLEWMQRVKALGISSASVRTATIRYDGFASSLWEAIRKWYTYAIANSAIDVRNNQKKVYFLAFILLMVALVYRWNFIFAAYSMREFYIPNITKIFVSFLFVSYVVYRGIIRPRQVRVSWSYLLPWRWITVSFVGLCLDTAKAPGLLLGAVLLVKRRLASRWRKPRNLA
jgi:glycosyltransferase involved in cell wall biosynthesis